MSSRSVRVALGVVLVLGAFLYGFLANERDLPPAGLVSSLYERALQAKWSAERAAGIAGETPGGRWRRAGGGDGLPEDRESAVEALASLGYAAGTQAVTGDETGVTFHDAERTQPGINLVVSGHGPEAFLMDASGRTLHRWERDFWSAFPDTEVPRDREPAQFWRRVKLLPGGDLLAIYEGNGLLRIDAESNVRWGYPGRAHHDLELAPDGRLWILSREIRFLPRIHPDKPVLEDYVVVLDPATGEELRRFSVLEAFENSPYATLLEWMPPAGDIFHTNSLQILDGRHADRVPAFARGNLLVSLHTLNLIAVLDPESATAVWVMAGPWKRQHEPDLLPGGNILLFDNQGHGGYSKVIEFDPATQHIAWSYEGDEHNGFYTELCGASQRLPNGNTLITQSEGGRAFEVNADGAIVWEYVSPYRAGKNDEFVATLLEVVRLPEDTPLDWVKPDGTQP